MLENLVLGLSVAVTPEHLFFCFVGVLIGTLVGVLPGLGPVTTMAMLLPLTYYLSPVAALIMLAGIYYGAQYGGSTTAILVNLPGEASSVVTCIDGYQMAKHGRAGAALAVAALGSFFAGTVATFLIVFFSPPLANLAQLFSSGNYFALMTFGLIAAIVLARGSPVKAIIMVFLGLFLGTVGTDVNTGMQRFTFGIPQLYEGINFVALGMGLFGIAEIIRNLESVTMRSVSAKVGGLWMTKEEFRRSWPAVLRGTGLGSILGILPGGGGLLASFASYTLEKKISKEPERFGHGAIEGVAAPESANNAGAQTSFIPLLTLGIPSNVVMAMMVGAMTIHGIIPGPEIMTKQPDLFWGMIASMWIGNLMLVVINLPLIGLWVSLLRVPYRFLFPTIIFICCIGVFSINNSFFDLVLMSAFGLIGYIFLKFDFDPAPLLLGFILGPMMEENLRRALLLSRGDGWILVTDPISAVMLGVSALLLISLFLPAIRRKREEAFTE